jgi:hypothetical protein
MLGAKQRDFPTKIHDRSRFPNRVDGKPTVGEPAEPVPLTCFHARKWNDELDLKFLFNL